MTSDIGGTGGIGNSTAAKELASIQSDTSRVQPISAAERSARVEKAARLMQENAVDALILPAGSSLYYFTGLRWYPSERLTAAILTPDGRLFYVCPGFEESKLRETLGADANIRLWQEEDDPCQLIKTCLHDPQGLAGPAINPCEFWAETAKAVTAILG